jgi:glycosyl hydrolase family 2
VAAGAAEIAAIPRWLRVSEPASVHMALYRAGELPHPYYNLNSEKYRPAERRVWHYRKRLPMPVSARGQFVSLCFEGADCFSRVWLNGELLGRHDGMFGGPRNRGSSSQLRKKRRAPAGEIASFPSNCWKYSLLEVSARQFRVGFDRFTPLLARFLPPAERIQRDAEVE